MNELKPGDLAQIVRKSALFECMNRCISLIVKVGVIAPPNVAEEIEGPIWLLQEGPRCPHGISYCPGLEVAPDRCLLPLPKDVSTDDADADQPVDATVE